MICGPLLWLILATNAFGFIDKSELADQLLEFTRPIIKENGDDAIAITGFKTNITDIFGFDMGNFVCEKGVFSDLSTIMRAGPAIMSKIVLRDDILLSLHVSAKLSLMELKFEACELTILDYPPKTVQPNITVGTNGIALVVSVTGKLTDCTTKLQKSSITQFSDMTVATGTEAPNTLTDGFLSGLMQGNQAEITAAIQKAIYTSLGKALNDAKICDFFREYLG